MKRLPREDNLSQIQGKGHKDAQLESAQRPDVDTLYILPCTNGCKTSEGRKTDDGIDLEACVMRPHLAENRVYDGRETIEEEGKTSEREEGEDGRSTRYVTGDDNRGDR